MFRGFFLPVFLIVANTLFSQNAKEDFEKMNKAFDVKALSMKIRYDLYKNKDTKILFQKEVAELKQSGNLKWMKIGKMETLETDKYSLLIDHGAKEISLLGKSLNQQNEKNSNPFKMNLDSLLKICEKVEFKNENENQNSYELVFPNSEYNKVKVVYNKKTFFIEKLIMYYDEKRKLDENKKEEKEAPRMEILCSEINTNPSFSDTDFTSDKYIEKTVNGKWIAKALYSSYEVHANLLNE